MALPGISSSTAKPNMRHSFLLLGTAGLLNALLSVDKSSFSQINGRQSQRTNAAWVGLDEIEGLEQILLWKELTIHTMYGDDFSFRGRDCQFIRGALKLVCPALA